MSTPTAGSAILSFCSLVEERICGSVDCPHMGQSCEAPGCDNSMCKQHGHYCPRCEQRYCEDCHAAHLEACYGAEADAYDERIERELTPTYVSAEKNGANVGHQPRELDSAAEAK